MVNIQTPTNPNYTQTPQPEQAPGPHSHAKIKEYSSNSFSGFLKLAYVIVFFSAIVGGSYFVYKEIFSKGKTSLQDGEILLQAPYQPVNWQGFGKVFEPMVKVPIVYPTKGVKDINFLLDSGALVSSLPREEAPKLGYNSLSDLQRSTFRGYGGTTSFAYKGKMKILVKDDELEIPVVFTEGVGTKKILGRAGFFQTYSIHFNANKKVIEVRK
jgi:hypothetical protein